MKYVYIFLLLFNFILGIGGLENVKGYSKVIETCYYSNTQDQEIKNFVYRFINIFDKNGNRIKIYNYDANNQLSSVYNYIYNYNNELMEINYGTYTIKYIYENNQPKESYDYENNKLVSKIFFHYKFNSFGQLETTQETYKLDELGKWILSYFYTVETYNKQNKVTSYYYSNSESNTNFIINYEYNDKKLSKEIYESMIVNYFYKNNLLVKIIKDIYSDSNKIELLSKQTINFQYIK